MIVLLLVSQLAQHWALPWMIQHVCWYFVCITKKHLAVLLFALCIELFTEWEGRIGLLYAAISAILPLLLLLLLQLMERLQNKHSFGLMAVSLGYADTLMSLSAASTSSELTDADKASADISEGYLRMSVGITGG